MVVGRCDVCGSEEYMPFTCKFCRGRFCAQHRLPEGHQCSGLEVYRERVRTEGGRWMTGDEADVIRPRVRAGSRLMARVDDAISRVEGRVTPILLGTMLGISLLAFALSVAGLDMAVLWLFIMDNFFFLKPWTILTSVFTHFTFNHFFFNALVLFFFGPTVEQIIGSKRFLFLFLGAGALGGLMEVVLFGYTPLSGFIDGRYIAVVGASGAIMGLLGCLTILAPRLKVLVMFVIPVPLYVLTIVYAAIDLLFAFSGGTGIAHGAHLSGLALGLWYGAKLKERGVRPYARSAGATFGRQF